MFILKLHNYKEQNMYSFEYMTQKIYFGSEQLSPNCPETNVAIGNKTQLNQLGDEGWELIQVIPVQQPGLRNMIKTDYFGIFKRTWIVEET